MKKLYFVIFACVFLLSACTPVRNENGMDSSNDNQTANDRFAQFLFAVAQKDTESIKMLFSRNAQIQAKNIDEQISDLLVLFQEDIISYTSAEEKGITVNRSFEQRHQTKSIEASFYIETETHAFHIAFLFCAEDSMDSNNVGITSVYIVSANDWNSKYVYRGGGMKNMLPGIYIEKTD